MTRKLYTLFIYYCLIVGLLVKVGSLFLHTIRGYPHGQPPIQKKDLLNRKITNAKIRRKMQNEYALMMSFGTICKVCVFIMEILSLYTELYLSLQQKKGLQSQKR